MFITVFLKLRIKTKFVFKYLLLLQITLIDYNYDKKFRNELNKYN